MNVGKQFVIMAIFTVISFLAFIHIGSYWADTHHLNWLCWVVGILGAAVAAYQVKIMLNNTNNYKKDEKGRW